MSLEDNAWPEGENKNVHQKEEDLYGYGCAIPMPPNVTAMDPWMPRRRSSLKTSTNACSHRASVGYNVEITLVLPTGRTQQRRTSITFADNSQVKEVKPVGNMADDPNRLWFQKEEYQHIQQNIYAIVDEAKKNGNK
jgi:hypothetical protein